MCVCFDAVQCNKVLSSTGVSFFFFLFHQINWNCTGGGILQWILGKPALDKGIPRFPFQHYNAKLILLNREGTKRKLSLKKIEIERKKPNRKWCRRVNTKKGKKLSNGIAVAFGFTISLMISLFLGVCLTKSGTRCVIASPLFLFIIKQCTRNQVSSTLNLNWLLSLCLSFLGCSALFVIYPVFAKAIAVKIHRGVIGESISGTGGRNGSLSRIQ